METAKQANKIINDVLALLTNKKDIARFTEVREIFNNAAGMVNGDAEAEAMLKAWIVSQANNAVFLAFRRNILTPEIEAAYRELPSTEEAMKDHEDFAAKEDARAKELEDARREFMEGQHRMDIFKAVLNGRTKEEAEKFAKEYQQKLAQALGA